MSKNQLWYFEWHTGGYNSVQASSRRQALKLAVEKGQPTLVPVEASLRPVTAEQMVNIDRSWASLCD